MELKAKIILISLILLVVAISFIIKGQSITGNVIGYRYSFTKAVCNESNFCQDYEISCNGNQTISRTPISRAVVQFSDTWTDPRTPEFINKECENYS